MRNADVPVYLVANLMPSGVGSENASSSLATGYPIRKSPLQTITIHFKIITQFNGMQLLQQWLEDLNVLSIHTSTDRARSSAYAEGPHDTT